MPAEARCLRGVDSAGAPHLIVVPAQWNNMLVVHAHGGPAVGTPQASRSDEDIQRWAITVRWLRLGGVGVPPGRGGGAHGMRSPYNAVLLSSGVLAGGSRSYVALFTGLLAWVERGEKPTPAGLAQQCKNFESQYGTGCHLLPAYQPTALGTRVTPRD